MRIRDFQTRIDEIYGAKDGARGTPGTYMWFAEEVGELSRALRRGDRENLEEEFADVLAWLSTLASMNGIDLEGAAAAKYAEGCPRCRAVPCACHEPRPDRGGADGPGDERGGADGPRDARGEADASPPGRNTG